MDKNGLIQWKTDAWKSSEMVSFYAERMVDPKGTNRLKNLLEQNLIAELTPGPNVLDIGIGTGRATVPLIDKGYCVTGIDSSDAMLAEAMAQIPSPLLKTLRGDVSSIPFENNEFDSAVSLNVLVHFPNWAEILHEWSRVIRDDGRIVFDIHSLDHCNAAVPDPHARQQALKESSDPNAPHNYMCRILAKDLVRACDDAGLAIIEAVPYGAFLGFGNRNFLLSQSIENKNWWKRLISWMETDDDLLEFCFYLERNVIAKLPLESAGRMMVVLQKTPNIDNSQWLAHRESKRAETHASLSRGELPTCINPVVIESIGARLDNPRCRHLYYQLLKPVMRLFPQLNWRQLAPSQYADIFSQWEKEERLDQQTQDILKNWTEALAGTKTAYRAIDTSSLFEYSLMSHLYAGKANTVGK